MAKRRKQVGWKTKLPVGTIRQRRRKRNGYEARYIKVSDTPPKSRQWILLAKWTWEQMHGPVPAGKRVVHLDGDTLHDEPSNYGLMTAGELIQLYHRLRPEMAARNKEAVRQATAECNRMRGRVRRFTRQWSRWRWYPVDESRSLIINRPFRSRRRLLAEVAGVEVAINGGISQRRLAELPFLPIRGHVLYEAPYTTFQIQQPLLG